MMISEGKGMQADSMAMVRTMPPYPKEEMTEIIHWAIGSKIFSNIMWFDIKFRKQLHFTCKSKEELKLFE